MRISRTNLVPVLTIMTGAAIGGLLTFSFLALSRSDDVPIAASATSANRLRFPSTFVLTGSRMEDDELVFTGEFKVPINESQLLPGSELAFNLMERRPGEFRTCFRYEPQFRITGLTLLPFNVWLPSGPGLACL